MSATTTILAASKRGHAGSRQRLRTWVVPLTLFIVALGIYLPRLTEPNDYVFDELYYAYTAGRFVAGDDGAYSTAVLPQADPAIEWTHPPLAKLIIAAGIVLFGDEPIGWRIFSALAGAATVVVLYQLALRLTGSRMVGIVAGGLILLDGLTFVESRVGMSNIFFTLSTSAALLAVSRVLTASPAAAVRPLLLTGVMLGLALAIKWSASALIGLVGLAVLWRIIQWRRSRERAVPTGAMLGWTAVSLIAIPAAIYLASYLHFFLTGHGLADLIDLHRAMFAYHRDLGVVHDYSSSWWEWPLAARPVWYYVDEGGRDGVYVFGNGNPLLYWPMVVAVLWVLVDWWGRRPAALVVMAIGFFGQWLPWALSPRGTFIYHFLPSVPFGCLALATVVVGAWRGGRLKRSAAVGYLLAVAITFLIFYPLHAAVPLSDEQVDRRIWLESWR